MQKIPYALAVGSLMYAQVCTHPDIAYIVGMLDRCLTNLGMEEGHVVFIENEGLHAHIQEIRSVRDHRLF